MLFRSILCQDTKLNISPAYLKPGFAFGGSCLPKDLRALTYQAKLLDLNSPVLNAILLSNSYQKELVINTILGFGKKRVGFVGMSFKPDTDDLRESPLVDVIETLLGKGYRVKIFDKNISISRLIGANKSHMDEHLPHLSCLLVDTVEALIDNSDVIVVGHKQPEFIAKMNTLKCDQVVIDLVRSPKTAAVRARYDGIAW